jgi:hypothetical protein
MEFHPVRSFFSFIVTFLIYQIFIKSLPAGALFSDQMWDKLGWTILDSLVVGFIFSFGQALSSVKDFVSQLLISILYGIFIIFGVYGSVAGFLALTMGIDKMDWFSAFWAQFLAFVMAVGIIWIFVRLVGWGVGVQAGDAADGALHRVAKGSSKGGRKK